MKIIVVADKNGTAKFKPFAENETHWLEPFWIGGEKFSISKDNRVKLGKKFMEKHGYLRADGRRALVIDTGARYYADNELTPEQREKLGVVRTSKNGKHLVQGGKIKKGKPYEKYMETGKTGNRVPADVGTGDEALDTESLEAYDSRDIYTG